MHTAGGTGGTPTRLRFAAGCRSRFARLRLDRGGLGHRRREVATRRSARRQRYRRHRPEPKVLGRCQDALQSLVFTSQTKAKHSYLPLDTSLLS